MSEFKIANVSLITEEKNGPKNGSFVSSTKSIVSKKDRFKSIMKNAFVKGSDNQ
jgi:hypothetical protein